LLAKRQQEKLLSRDVHVDALRSIIAIIFQEKVRFFPGLLSFQLDAA
jgi:hypothetical protein